MIQLLLTIITITSLLESFTPSSIHVNAISTSTSSQSPWAPAIWKIRLNFGREAGTLMPKSWGASGSRLVIPNLQVEFDSSEPPSSSSSSSRQDQFFTGYRSCMELRPLEPTPTFVTLEKGQVPFLVSNGGWTMGFPPNGGNVGKATTLRFWCDVRGNKSDIIQRNDISLEAGERLYFMANCWREADYEIGVSNMIPIQRDAQQAQQRLEEQVSHETGDRRLDGNELLKTIEAYSDMTKLVLERDVTRQKCVEASKIYPPPPSGVDDDSHYLPEGPWPGTEEWLSISKSNPIFVKRRTTSNDGSNLMSLLVTGGEEYHIVGTWEVEPVLNEDDYEEY